MHIVQIYRANELEFSEGVAILTKLDAASMRNLTWRHTHGRPYYCDINKFKMGFMHNFGSFYVSVLQPCDKAVIFVQV